MIDFDLNFRMKRRSAALEHGEPRALGVRRLLVVVALVAVLTFAYVVLGVSPNSLLGVLT